MGRGTKVGTRDAALRASARKQDRHAERGTKDRDQTCTSSTYPQARYRPDYSREYESPQKQDRSHEGLYTPWVGPHDNELNHLPSTCFVLPRRPCDHGDMRRPLPSGRHLQQQERHQRDERRLQYFLNPSTVRTSLRHRHDTGVLPLDRHLAAPRPPSTR